MSEQLLPCPFCGCDAEYDTSQFYRTLSGNLDSRVVARCSQCEAEIGVCRADHRGESVDDLLKAVSERWNQRSLCAATIEALTKAKGQSL